MAYGFMNEPEKVNVQTQMLQGQAIAGSAIGIVVLDLWYPYMPGNVANASTFNFPVTYKVLKGSTGPQITSADPGLLDMIVEEGKELERQGARALIGACGYFANYQKDAAAALDIPVFLSSILQVPVIRRGLKPNQKVGIICAVAPALTPKLLSQCGVDNLSEVVIAGAQDLSEFRNIIDCTGHFDSYKLEQQLVGLAKEFVTKNP
ncbi:MAG: aspartate/glutamate racemase family protein, partial [Dehalococcoidia bacterium]|nr:aspartate/glutamate racemase family protein [Dehalococcoidia bacterium]